MLGKIGADATGLPFNSIMAILLENDHPSTPLVNAGAISACSMIKPVGDSDGKWKAIVSFIADLAGSDVAVIDELYKSETATNFNNKSIAWLLKNYNRIYDDPDMALDIYTRQCSIGVTARQLATMAATIANSGVNPVTGKAVFKPELTPKIASMMALSLIHIFRRFVFRPNVSRPGRKIQTYSRSGRTCQGKKPCKIETYLK